MWPQGNHSVSLHWITNWGFFMSANISSIKSHPDFFSGKKARSRQRVFDLGEHSFAGMPGCDWRTNYWVKRIEKGQR